jgi:hypothetical protein
LAFIGSPLAVSGPYEYQEAWPHWLAAAGWVETVATAEHAATAKVNATMREFPDFNSASRL